MREILLLSGPVDTVEQYASDAPCHLTVSGFFDAPTDEAGAPPEKTPADGRRESVRGRQKQMRQHKGKHKHTHIIHPLQQAELADVSMR